MLITVNSTPDNVVFKETVGRLHTEGIVFWDKHLKILRLDIPVVLMRLMVTSEIVDTTT